MNRHYKNELHSFWEKNRGWGDWTPRGEAVRKWAWAVPNEEAIEVLRLWPTVEIGAGTGYWASLVAASGGDIIAYDREPYSNRYCEGRHFEVQKGGTRVVEQHADRSLFICWPPYNKCIAQLALKAFRRAGGYRFVYVGEPEYGCTGDRAFFKELDRHWVQQKIVEIPQWDGVHDYMWVYTRR